MDLELESSGRRIRKFNVTETRRQKQSKSEKKYKRKSYGAIRNTVFVSHFFIIVIELILRNIGLLLSRKGIVVSFFSLLFFGALCMGFLWRLENERPPDLYRSTNTKSRRDFDEANKIFPTLDSWKVQLDVRSKSGGNVLTSGCLHDATQVHNLLINNSFYKRHCLVNKDGKCTTHSPATLQGFGKNDLEILTGLNLSQSGFEKVFHFHESLVFYTISYNQNVSIGRFIFSYFLKKPKTNQERLDLKEWIQQMASIVKEKRQSLKFADISVLDINLKEDKVWTILLLKPLPLIYSIPIILAVGIVFTVIVCRYWLSLLAFPLLIICTLIGFICAFAACNIFGIVFQELFIIVPCILFPKAFIDSLLLLKALERVSHLPSSDRRASSSLVNGGLLVTTTTLIDILLFGVPIWSSFKGISHLFVLALLSLLFTYLTTLTLFFNFVLWITRKKPTIFFSARCVPDEDNKNCLQMKALVKSWVNHLSTILAKVVFALVISGMIASSICILVAFNPKFKTMNRFNKESNPINAKESSVIGSTTEEVTIVFRGLNYSTQTTRSNLVQCSSRLNSIYSDNNMTANWVESLEKWKEINGKVCTFYPCLADFINNSITSFYQSDMKFQSKHLKVYIETSRFRIPVTFTDNIFKDKSKVESFQRETKKSFGENAKPVSKDFLATEDFITFLSETLYVYITLAIALVVLTFPLTSSLRTPFVLLLTFVMLSLEVVALMCLLGVAFNQLSFTCVLLVLVLAFNYSIYVTEAFIISKTEKVKHRMIDAVHSTAIPVVLSCFLLVLMSVVVGFGFPHLESIFMQAVPVTLGLGVFHAFVLLPYLLISYGNNFTKRLGHSSVPMNSVIVKGYRRRSRKNRVSVAPLNDSPKFPCVAVIGMSCRFPQVSNKDEFWHMLTEGHCTVSSFPENRPDEYKLFKERYHPKRFVPGRMCTLGGSYMENIRGFDAAFFNISSQEANAMDPQQRILLQVVYEAVEDSGMKLEDLQGCKTGVFVGLMNTDFSSLLTHDDNVTNVDQFASTGTSASIVSNRISFCFNFKGPSLTVDTACSSSLTALNIAVDSLRNGDCNVALVCGSNLVLCDKNHMITSIAGLLAPDGKCKSFDSSGDGYGRGEGVAAVVLKLSEVATKDEDDIYCEVIACGMNNDGATAMPMTAPSIRGQSEVAKVVLNRSGLTPSDVDYVEAHGTGTAIGDVVETSSIAEVYGVADRMLRIGSIKSNLNHTESTAGLAGLMKLALMIKYGRFVPTINVYNLNPKLKLTEKGLTVQELCEPWERTNGQPRIGAVNSFGYGGSNAHVILREVTHPLGYVDEMKGPNDYCNEMNIITLSARSSDALKDSAQSLAEWLLSDTCHSKRMRDICYSLNERRTLHSHRLAVAFASVDEAAKSLEAFYDDRQGWEKSVSVGDSKQRGHKLLFMFGGQGAQWFGMGRELILKEAVVRDTISEIDKIIRGLGEKWNLKAELMAPEEESKVDEMVIGQIATFSVQFAIARLLISWGVHPTAVVGHSLGEYAASCVAGAITLKETLKLVLLRAKLQSQCPKNGAMAALGMSAEKAQHLLEKLKLDATVSIAAYNDANSVTLSGDKQSIECFGEDLQINNTKVFWRVLNTPRAFHSSHVAPIETSFKALAQKKKPKPKETSVPFYSTVEGNIVSGRELDVSYWWQNIRKPVKFHQAIRCALDDGYRKIVEIGVQPTLSHYIKQIASQEELTDDDKPIVFQTLPRKTVKEQHKTFVQNTICSLSVIGYPVQWHRVRGPSPCTFVRLPTYPWQEKGYWYRQYTPEEIILPLPSTTNGKHELIHPPHPFLGKVLTPQQFSGISCWAIEIDLHKFPLLMDHALSQGSVIMPGAVYIEMAFAIAKERFSGSAVELHDVRLSNVLTLPESQVRHLRLRLTSKEYPFARFNITVIQDDQSELELSSGDILCEATIDAEKSATTSAFVEECLYFAPEIKALQQRMETFPIEELHAVTKRYGFAYGPRFSVIKQAWKAENEGLCLISIDSDSFKHEEIDDELAKYVVHPSVLDACLQSCFIPISTMPSDKTIVPVGFDRIQLTSSRLCRNTICHVVQDPSNSCFDMTLMSLSGKIILKMKNFRVAELDGPQPQASIAKENIAYEITWKKTSFEALQPMQYDEMVAVVLMDSSRISSYFIEILEQRGVEVFKIKFPETKDCGPEEGEEIGNVIQIATQRCLSSEKKLKIVSFWPIEADLVPQEFDSIDRAQNIAFKSSLLIIKLIGESALDASAIQVTYVTQGICSVKEHRFPIKSHLPWSSTIWGLRRTGAVEYPNTVIRTVDLSTITTDYEIEILADQLGLLHNEEELVIRENAILTSRVDHSPNAFSLEEPTSTKEKENNSGNFYFEQNPETQEIFLREDTCAKLLQDEVIVELSHVFSNEESISAFANNSSHVGFSGHVVELMGLTFKVGEEVFGVAKPSRLGKRLKISEKHLIRKPQEMSLSQAAAIPSCFVMALEIVQKTLPQQKCLRLLIHEGDTSLGFALITVAKMHGHHVWCSTNEESIEATKKVLLESGVEKITDPSCLDLDESYHEFFDAVIFISSHQPGVLNTSLRLLKAKGILLVACGTFNGNFFLPGHKCIRYERVHIADLMSNADPFCNLWKKHCAVILSSALMDKIEIVPQVTLYLSEEIKKWNEALEISEKKSTPSIFKTYAIDRIDNLKALPAGIDHFGLKSNRTYIVAGGVRGYGFEVARWICSHGAHTVVLLARSPPSKEKLKEVQDIQSDTGARIDILQIDVSREDHMISLEKHLQDLPSVAGIIHTAMVLRDSLIKDMEIDSYRDVMAPKVKGGYLLHKLSLKMDLDFFVMFSSMASMIFNVSQASYSAANAFLDGLASYRRNVLGIPGLSINWGPIGGAGVLTRQSNVAKMLSKAGLGLIPASEGPKYMSKISGCQPNRTQIGLFIVDWPAFLGTNVQLSKLSRLELLRNAGEENGSSVQTLASRILLESDATKRLAMINEFVLTMLAYWADMESTSEVDISSSLYNYGIDSTAALSLKMTLESSLQISFEVFYFMQPETTPAKMTQDIAHWFQTRSGDQATPNDSNQAQLVEKNNEDPVSPSNGSHIQQTTKPSVQVFPLYNPEDAEIKFFCIHPAYRFALNMASIANGFQIQNIVSFYVIGFKEPTYEKEDWGSVRELAMQYVDLIREEQKHGPYFLGGYSYGGIVVYEIANILVESKERVEFVCMIDTHPWSPIVYHGGYYRLKSWFHPGVSYMETVEILYEAFIEKVAKENLKMTNEEYDEIKSQHSTEEIIKFLEERSRAMNVPVYDFAASWEITFHDSMIASRTHEAWEPPAIQYRGRVTYLACQDKKFTPKIPLIGSVAKCWKNVFQGPMDVLVCPGDHFSLREMPFARITGGIVATAAGVKYRSLYPKMNHLSLTYVQKKAVNQLKEGVPAILHPKKARKNSKSGTIFLNDDNQTLRFCQGDHSTKPSKLTGKVIKLQELRCIMPGRYVHKTIKVVAAKRKTNSTVNNQGGNLSNVVSLFGKRRIFNVEFLNFDDLKEFYLVVEGILKVKMEFF